MLEPSPPKVDVNAVARPLNTRIFLIVYWLKKMARRME